MSIAVGVFEHRTLLHNVPWEMYQALRTANPSGLLRMTYDHGILEIMSPSRMHERIAMLIGLMIHEWTMRKRIHIGAGRNTTFTREDLLKGLEPDNCYWVTHERQMRDKDEVDLAVDPPPDLALEVDVTHSSVPKLPIYQALGVPELWRWRHESLEVLRLDDTGEYQPSADSVELRDFPLALAVRVIRQRQGKSDTQLIQKFVRHLKSRR